MLGSTKGQDPKKQDFLRFPSPDRQVERTCQLCMVNWNRAKGRGTSSHMVPEALPQGALLAFERLHHSPHSGLSSERASCITLAPFSTAFLYGSCHCLALYDLLVWLTCLCPMAYHVHSYMPSTTRAVPAQTRSLIDISLINKQRLHIHLKKPLETKAALPTN